MGFDFQTTPSMIVDPDSMGRIGDVFSRLGCRRILLVTDKGIEAAGLLASCLSGLNVAGISHAIFTDVVADPPDRIIAAAVDVARTSGCDGVLGLGGGSSLDTAKLVALLRSGKDRLEDIYGVGLAKGPRLPLVLAPTTAGTGSEVTPISIVTTSTGEKKGVVSPLLLPDCAILDADLTLGLPSHVTAATGIDAMVHAIEAFTSKRLKNPLSDTLAREALRLLSSNIYVVCRDGRDRSARQAMLLGSMLAGMAFANAPVAAVHALAYPIGGLFHVPHGLSNAMVLPHVVRFNAATTGSLYAQIADIVVPGATGSDATKTKALVSALAALAPSLGLDVSLRSAGIKHRDLPRMAEDAMKQTRLLVNNPRELTYADALAIYEQAL